MNHLDVKQLWPQAMASFVLVILATLVYLDVNHRLDSARNKQLETWDLRIERTKLNLEAFTKYYNLAKERGK